MNSPPKKGRLRRSRHNRLTWRRNPHSPIHRLALLGNFPSPTPAGLLLFLLLFLCSLEALASCERLFQQQKYAQAAACFVRCAQSFPPDQRLAPQARLKKGRCLRNAVISWEIASKKAQQSKEKTYILERALRLVLWHNEERLFLDREEAREWKGKEKRLRQHIGYALLTLVANHPKARICLQGYHFQRCKEAQIWTLQLRPGWYQIQVRYPLKPVVLLSRKVHFKRSVLRNLLFHPPYVPVSVVTNDPQARLTIEGSGLLQSLHAQGKLWSYQLPPGTYRVTVRYPQRGSRQRRFRIQKKPTILNIPRPPALPLLHIESQPQQARVYLNQRYRGKTKLQMALPPGSYRLGLHKACYFPLQRNFRLHKDHTLSLTMKRKEPLVRWERHKSLENVYRILSWTALGLGVVAAGVALGSHVYASARQEEALLLRAQNPIVNRALYQKRGEEGNLYRTVGYASLGASALLVSLGSLGLTLASPGPKNDLPCFSTHNNPSNKHNTPAPASRPASTSQPGSASRPASTSRSAPTSTSRSPQKTDAAPTTARTPLQK